ncbi:MAG: TRAM domain-containing protein [Deltaproteobacteria bacterium]|nr:TRAM domain-containing protein [Deltaproteobacteria bacterium]
MYILMRALLVIFASASGYFIILPIIGSKLAYVGLISGLLIALAALTFEERVKKTPLKIVIGGAGGLITGLIVANLLAYPLALSLTGNRYLELGAYLFTNCVIGYIGLSIGMKKGDEFDTAWIIDRFAGAHVRPPAEGVPALNGKTKRQIVIDTSVIIDGRIAELCETGFIEGALVVPQFVLQELQYIADSPDQVKRVRGKRGLDILKQIQKSSSIIVEITEKDFHSIREVDSKLVALAKELGAKIFTNDSNLNKIAELQGVSVLNMNKLATAMKPVALPGEVMNILVLKEGKEQGQGIGYLEDGTMVVVDNGRDYLGKAVDVAITSVLQTTGGRMIFSKMKDDLKKPVLQ